VHDPSVVGLGEPEAGLGDDLQRELRAERAEALEELLHVFAGHVLHDHERQPAARVGAGVEHLADVLRVDRAGGLGLAVETRHQRGVLRQVVGADDLERDATAGAHVLGLVHVAHAATTDGSGDFVAAIQGGSDEALRIHVSGSNGSLRHRVGARIASAEARFVHLCRAQEARFVLLSRA